MYRIQHMKGVTTPPKRKEVKVIHSPASPQTTPDCNPYDLVEVMVGKLPTPARPIEFDSEAVDNHTLKNAAGCIIKPTKLSTTCPHCGCGIVVDVVASTIDGVIQVGCEQCGSGMEAAAAIAEAAALDLDWADPFCNPLVAGRLTDRDLDPEAAPATLDLESLGLASALDMGPECETVEN